MQISIRIKETITSKERIFFCFLLMLLVLLIFLRQPEFFFKPRFWAEEGSIHFKNGYEQPWLKAIFSCPRGYYSFLPNLAGVVAANCPPLEHAPLVTTLFALIFQLIPYGIVFWGKSPYLEGKIKKILIALLILFNWATGEIWLNTINSQFYLVLATFLILLTDGQKTGATWNTFYCFLLLVASLTGPVACFLLPLAIFRAFVQKNRGPVLQAAALGLGTIVQLIAVLGFFPLMSFQNRIVWKDTRIFLQHIVVNGFLRNFFPRKMAESIMQNGLFIYVIIIFLLAVLSLRVRLYGAIIFIGSFICVAFPSLLLSLGAFASPRYFYAPSVFIMILLCQNLPLRFTKEQWFSRIVGMAAILLIISSLFLNIVTYRSSLKTFYDPQWPDWREEVRRWRENPAHSLKIWPAWPNTVWKITLLPKK